MSFSWKVFVYFENTVFFLAQLTSCDVLYPVIERQNSSQVYLNHHPPTTGTFKALTGKLHD
jgi:hypothetical protein